MKIDSFRGKYSFLSNFYMVPINLGNMIYKSAEHAFQAAKTKDKKIRKLIAQAKTPGKAKRLGREVVLRPNWEKRKFEIMYKILWAKFSQNRELMKKLLKTGDAELIEGNTWGDQYWGICRGKGENKLGKLLMLLREEFSIQDWG
jgi:ribA/ribD-fused uncharacterized protein